MPLRGILVADQLHVERLLSERLSVRKGSGRDLALSEFIAVKPPLKFRLPKPAIRH